MSIDLEIAWSRRESTRKCYKFDTGGQARGVVRIMWILTRLSGLHSTYGFRQDGGKGRHGLGVVFVGRREGEENRWEMEERQLGMRSPGVRSPWNAQEL